MTLDEFKSLNKRIGQYWFSEDTMSFFSSFIHDFDEENGLFISSEIGPFGYSPRKYTIRKADFSTGRVSTISEFQEYETLAKAQNKLKKLILRW